MNEPRIDPAKPENLRRQGGSKLLVLMIESFLETAARQVGELAATTDPVVVARIAHAFKTSCRIVGAMRLGEQCEELEETCASTGSIRSGAIPSLVEEYAQVRPWFEDLLRSEVGIEPEPSVIEPSVKQTSSLRRRLGRAALVAAALMAASLWLWSALASTEEATLRQETADALESVRSGIATNLATDIQVLERMRRRWEQQGGTPHDLWLADALACARDRPHVQAIEWVDETFHVRWIAPLEGNEDAMDLDLSLEARRRGALERARDERTTVASEMIELIQGGQGVLVFVPIFVDAVFSGFILGVYRVEPLMDQILAENSPQFSVHVSEDGNVFYTRGDALDAAREKWAQTASIDIHGVRWDIQVWPGDPALQRLTALPLVTLIGGCLAALLLALVLFLAETAEQRARQFERTNVQLRQAVQDRARTEAQALDTQKLESIGVLAGGIAHDFNNLLASILGNAELIRASLPDSSAAQPRLERIELIVERAAELCDQLLAYAGRGEFTPQVVVLEDLVREMSQLLDVTVSRQAHIEMEFRDGPLAVEGDPAQLRQIIMNLVMNASEALGPPGGRLTIRVGRTHPSATVLSTYALGRDLPVRDYVMLEVTDTGSGMDEETQKRVFEPFYTTKRTGRGLGMAAVFGIVRRHQGALRILSAPGEGTTVCLLLPAADLPSPDNVVADMNEPTSVNGKGQTILIVDDEEDIRWMLRSQLEDAGYKVLLASNGEEALELAALHRGAIRAVVLDLTMPGLDGAATLATLRSNQPDLPIVICSGYGEEEMLHRVGRDSAAGLLKKPFRRSELLTILHGVLDGSDEPDPC